MTREYELRRYEYPGKFEGGLIIDTVAYAESMDGCGETLSDDSGESATRLDGPIVATVDPDGNPLSKDEVAYLAGIAGCIVSEWSTGFVDVTYYETEEELNAAWDRAEAAFSSDEGSDDR